MKGGKGSMIPLSSRPHMQTYRKVIRVKGTGGLAP